MTHEEAVKIVTAVCNQALSRGLFADLESAATCLEALKIIGTNYPAAPGRPGAPGKKESPTIVES